MPPTEGTRDDLVFLEVWRDQTTQEWKSRIRVVDGADFSVYADSGMTATNVLIDPPYVNTKVTPQGGNDQPVVYATGFRSQFLSEAQRSANKSGVGGVGVCLGDVGLYIAGRGDDTSKGLLKTYDGYVYAIPLFKVNRRNSGNYSATNPNGARNYASMTIATGGGASGVRLGDTITLTVNSTSGVNVGDNLVYTAITSMRARLLSINSSTSITILITGQNSYSSTDSWNPGNIIGLVSERPDSLYANIIDERDITDLRHKVYLTAPSYNQLLIDGTDQILRGASQVERKKAMRKTYVGVRKTPLDANHVFYSSLDGTTVAEVGGDLGIASPKFTPHATGVGLLSPGISRSFSVNQNQASVEAWFEVAQLQDPTGFGTGNTILQINTNLFPAQNLWYGVIMLGKVASSGPNSFYMLFGDTASTTITLDLSGKLAHLRLTADLITMKTRLYLNGKQVREFTINSAINTLVGWQVANNLRSWRLSDIAVSNIDRGATFATLPADFIANYADIMPALNFQRRINSDAQTSQKSYAVAKVQNQTQERGVIVTKGAGVNTAIWEAGDKIKVKGLAGEIIGGVIDSDTALAKVTISGSGINPTFGLDDLSKLSVNDTVTIRNADMSAVFASTATITAIDTANKTITVNSSGGNWNVPVGYLLFETTASTSTPAVRAIIAGTSTTVPGTWANLGTNEAEITLGTLPGGLDVEDIIVEYSLNMPAGQGGLYQVYAKTLGGEANGKKLIPGSVAVTDDFMGKVAGSTTVNPNKAYSATNGPAAIPAAPGTEFTQGEYDAIKTLDASLKAVTTSVNGQQAAILMSFDLIREFENKYAIIPGSYTVAEKVAWLKANVSKANFTWWGYGSGPAGNKASLVGFNVSGGNVWNYPTDQTSATVTKTQKVSTITSDLDANGFLHFLAYAGASDGVTASTLYMDHVSIEFEVVTKSGYDTLVPENPRRDTGLAGVLYVRRQTREVESLFPGNDEDNGTVVIGDYVPTQEMATATISGVRDVLLGMQGFVTTAGTNKAAGADIDYATAIARLLGPGDPLAYQVDPQSLIGTTAYDASGASGVMRYWYPDFPYGTGPQGVLYSDGIPTWAAKAAEFLAGITRLVEYNGELLLMIDMRKRSSLSNNGLGGSNTARRYYRLPGRPLIKS
ncbi:hypothetical protein [Paenibacillus sophorae]|uniref:hypothetical protein n=1 Tax=Paenibacillus sophorae TaxID=1333845 RepID=UPI001113F97E|nr:hypothetical protein [Paenibacillus sophorae]